MIFQRILTETAKTDFFISIFDHGVDTYHVVKYLLMQNPHVTKKDNKPLDDNIVKLAALVHDIGKLKKDFQSKGNREQWKHSIYTSEFLVPLVKERSFLRILEENDLFIPENLDDLIRICEKHHSMDAPLLRDYPEALLVAVGDAVASMLASGLTANLLDLLRRYPYSQVTLAELKAFGFDQGLDIEIHRLELPANLVEDVFLATMIFQAWSVNFKKRGIFPLNQRRSSLWVIGQKEKIVETVKEINIDPRSLYDLNFDKEIYSWIMDKILTTTGAGGLQADQVRFLLINEFLAKRLAREILFRDSARASVEKLGLSVRKLQNIFSGEVDLKDKIIYAANNCHDYLITGSNAAYYYHRWRSPIPKMLFLKVRPEEVDFWYAYLRDSENYVSEKIPGRKEITGFGNTIVLDATLKDKYLERKKVSENLAYMSPEDMIVEMLAEGGEGKLSEATATIYSKAESLDWKMLGDLLDEREKQRTFLKIINGIIQETKDSFRKKVPEEIAERSSATGSDEIMISIVRKVIEDMGEM